MHELPNKEEIAFREKWIADQKAAGNTLPWEKKGKAAPAPKAKAKAKPKAKSKTLCRNYKPGVTGSCPYGEDCLFQHKD